MEYQHQDSSLESWEQLTIDSNGIYGEIDVIDEIQNWFSSNKSSSFPPDFLHIITQQRKVRRCIIGTSQVFSRISKPLREQTQYLYMPLTLFGCFTICRVYEVEIDQQGDLKSKNCKKTFCFVHDKELRESYDSYKVIEDVKSGYKKSSDKVSESKYTMPGI
jgi:ATP-dependent Clp protease ATP-binding subunit ClpX